MRRLEGSRGVHSRVAQACQRHVTVISQFVPTRQFDGPNRSCHSSHRDVHSCFCWKTTVLLERGLKHFHVGRWDGIPFLSVHPGRQCARPCCVRGQRRRWSPGGAGGRHCPGNSLAESLVLDTSIPRKEFSDSGHIYQGSQKCPSPQRYS